MTTGTSIFKNKAFLQLVRVLLLLVFSVYLIFRVLYSFNFFMEEISCGAEQIIKKGDKEYLVSNVGYRYDSSIGRTDERAFEGKYSVKLTTVNPYGMSITFDEPRDDEEMEASVWCYMNKISADTTGYAFIVAKVDNSYWNGSYDVRERKNGWGKLSIKFTIPKGK